ncbi:MAG: sugar phosphate isomerase/epimerase [Clostridia bacterium]|nr:sugar phosphate isomerase/epimerase [Clostridia bacterium]
MALKIGAMVESFRKDFRGGVEAAAALGVDGVQAYATNGELSVANMTPDRIKEVLDIVKSNGLCFSAICGDFGKGFLHAELNDELVEKSKRVLDLAKKLECNIVTTHIGKLTAEETPEKEAARKACRELALYADSIGSCFAVETGPEVAPILADFLDSLGAMGVRVNLDPANLVMCSCDDPVKAVHTLKKYIVHTHAKDGINISTDPLQYKEMALGQGSVDFDNYLQALHEIGFDGFLTIERECGETPEADISLAMNYLKEIKAKYNI